MKGRDIALYSARTADEKKDSDIIVYDLRGLSDIADYFVIVTANSKAQIRAICQTIHVELKACGLKKLGQEGNESGQWVLLDYADCVVHIFTPALRAYYGIESLWGDAPKGDWEREPQVQLPRALSTGTAG